MGGPSDSTINTQSQIEQTQQGIAQQQNQLQQQNYARMNELEQPAISYYSNLISGDQALMNQAIAPQIGNIAQGYISAAQGIKNQIGPGAARDLALSNLETQKDSATAQFLNNTVLNAYGQLAGFGQNYGGFSLQELGATSNLLSGASSSNQQLGQMQAAASPWNAVSSLIGDAMGMFKFGTGSDIRIKTNVEKMPDVLDEIERLNIITYDYKKPEVWGTGQHIGVVAQELQTFFPEIVRATAVESEGEVLTVDYRQLIPVCMKAIQELSARIKQLEAELNAR